MARGYDKDGITWEAGDGKIGCEHVERRAPPSVRGAVIAGWRDFDA